MSRRRARRYGCSTQFGGLLLIAIVVAVGWNYGQGAAAGSWAAAFSDAVSGAVGWVWAVIVSHAPHR